MCVWLCISHASLSLRLIGITRKNNMYVRNKCAAGRFLSVRFLLIAYHSWFQQHSRCCWVDVVMLLFAFVFLLLVVWSLLVWGFFFFLSFFFFTFPLSFSLQFSRESENVSTAMEYYYSRPHSMLNGKKDEEQKRNHRKQPQSWKIWTKWLRYRYSRLKSK